MTIDEWIIEPAGYDGFTPNDLVRGTCWGFDVGSLVDMGAAITELAFDGLAILTFVAEIIAVTEFAFDAVAHFNVRGDSQIESPKA
jgi:hypothetical protein